MNDNKREQRDYWKETKFVSIILLVIGVLASIPLWFPGITISRNYTWITSLLGILVPVLITTGLVSMFLDSYSTYQYFKKHISSTLISNDYLQNLSQGKCSELRSILLSKEFISDLSTEDLLQVRNSLTASALESLYGKVGIDTDFLQKLDNVTSDITMDKCYIDNFEMTIHFYEEIANGETYMRKIVKRKIEYVNVTTKDVIIPVIKPRSYVKIENTNFFEIKCFVNGEEKGITVKEIPIKKENSLYNIQFTSEDTVTLKPGVTMYKEETSALLPLSDKDMILRMGYPCKSIKIDFIYDGIIKKDLLCWAFCPNAVSSTEAENFTQDHLRLTVQGPLFKGEGIVFRYQDVS